MRSNWLYEYSLKDSQMSSYIRNETLNDMPPMTDINIGNSNQNIGVEVFYYPKLSNDKDITN